MPPSATPAAKGTLCLTFDNMGRAMEIARGKASTPDDNEPGFAVGYPRLLGLLDSLGLHGTFFIEGWNALHHADRILDLVKRGHEVGLHGWIHEDFAALDRLRAEQYLHDGAAAMNRIGVRPSGFRAPGGYRGEHTIDILRTLGFRYDSSTDADERSTRPGLLAPGLAHIPWRPEMVDSIQYLRHPVRPRTPLELEAMWKGALDSLQDGAITLVIHAFVSGVDDQRFAVVRRVLSHALELGMEVTTAGALAERVLTQGRNS